MVKTLLSALSLYNFKRKQDNVEIKTNSYHKLLLKNKWNAHWDRNRILPWGSYHKYLMGILRCAWLFYEYDRAKIIEKE